MTRVNWLIRTRVVDLTTMWAGTAPGRLLGALGADVVKVESARRVDIWRGNNANSLKPPGKGKHYDQTPHFLGLNRNKRGISLELTQPVGKEVFLRLVEVADVMVSNFTARVLPNLGLTYETLNEINPRLVMLNMPSLGASGPYKDLAGYGSIIEGAGGMASRFGYLHEGARVSPTFFPDGVVGIHAALSLLAALRKRELTGQGTYIDFSHQEAMWLQLGEGIVMSSLAGTSPQRLGNAEPRRVPSGIFPSADGAWVAIVVKSDQQFADLVDAAKPHLDAFFTTDIDKRLAAREPIDQGLTAWTSSLPIAELLEQLTIRKIRAAPVNNYESGSKARELLSLKAFEQVEHPDAGEQTYLRIPIRLDGQPLTTQRPAPRFSEHTDEVLREWLGMGDSDLARLRKAGVIVDEITFPS